MSSKERMRRKRKRDMLQDGDGTSYEDVTGRHTEEEEEEEEDKEGEGDAAAVFSYFENNITTLTPILADEIGEWLDTYPSQWIIDAIDISVKRSKRRADYIHGILRNWLSDGKDGSASDNGGLTTVEKLIRAGYGRTN